MEEYFPLNLELWGRTYPREAVLLPYVSCPHLSLCQTLQAEENLCDRSDGESAGNPPEESKAESKEEEAYLHAQSGAAAEAANLFASIPKEGIELIYFYGIGLGYLYEAALSWLSESPSRSLVFFEDDIGVIWHFFHTKRALDLLRNPQVSLLYIKAGTDLKKALGAYCWNFLFLPAQISALPHYEQKKKRLYAELQHAIAFESAITKQLLEEYLHYGAAYFYNCYQNLLFLHRSYLGNGLFGSFPKVPAIICGAGPSLEKNRHLLQQLQQRALIFSGGSATNALNSIGMQPHFCVGIDPNEAQLQRLSNNVAFEVPFFYRSRLNHGAFLKIHAPHLYLTGGEGYGVTDFFEARLKIEGENLEEGHNVINFALEIAHKMGCNPIIFVGMDLAFTADKSYSDGVLPHTDGLEGAESPATERLQREDIFGRAVTTEWKWIAEAEWIGKWAKEHAETTLFNCTEGGIGFPGIPNKPLLDAVQAELRQEWDLAAWIHTEIQNSRPLGVTKERIAMAMEELKTSLKRSLAALSTLIQATKDAKKTCTETHQMPAQSGLAALAEIDLAEEPAYEHILAMFNLVYSQYLNRELMQLKQTSLQKAAWEKEILEIDINQKKLQFLSNVAAANLELIDYALSDKEKAAVKVERISLPKMHRDMENLLPPSNADAQIQTKRYPNGKTKSISHYKAGRLHGESIYYSLHGNLVAKGFFVAGLPEGEFLWYYPTGTLYSKQFFFEGLKEGPQHYFYEDGTLKTSLQYLLGDLVGEIRLYTPEGQLCRHIQNA